MVDLIHKPGSANCTSGPPAPTPEKPLTISGTVLLHAATPSCHPTISVEVVKH